jgi:unsaturated chondroitin disaccharide hydrolase
MNNLVQQAFQGALLKIDKNLTPFRVLFPDDTTRKNIYPLRRNRQGIEDGSNVGWTTSFWTGMLWLAYEWTGESKYRQVAEEQVVNFSERIFNRKDVDHHDLGFLYTLSCVAAYRLTGSEVGKKAALAAADYLLTRIWQKPGIIQAWGAMDNHDQRGRTIIDSLMNLPLLYWASQTTGSPHYHQASRRHGEQLRKYQVRDDFTTYHTFYFDTETGAPRFGQTAQGAGDLSCWARGQAWAMYGFLFSYIYTKESAFLEVALKLTDYFLAHSPTDRVAYWDLMFGDGSGEERDSSASAIAVCAMLEMVKWLSDPAAIDHYKNEALLILESLIKNYSTLEKPESNALLLHGVYSKPAGNGVDEANIWGDYFYLEALMRVANPDWKMYW